MDAPGTIRRLSAIQRDKLREHLLRLDPEDRLLRFGGYASDARIEAYCQALDWSGAVVIGYLVDGEVRGLGELKPTAESWPRSAEAAFSVERPYQNRGVGTELLRRLIVIARNRSIRSLHLLCFLENGKVLRIARKLGARLTFDQGEVEGRLALPWPNQLTLLLELLVTRAPCSPSCAPLGQPPHRMVSLAANSERRHAEGPARVEWLARSGLAARDEGGNDRPPHRSGGHRMAIWQRARVWLSCHSDR